MKTTRNLLLTGIVAVFCCFTAKAQIIYSNNFSLGTGVSISNTPPTLANTYAGGTSTALWTDENGFNNTTGKLLDNGINLCGTVDYWCLPFKPETNHVYLLTVNLTLTNGGSASEIGFSPSYATNSSIDGRFNGSVGGFDWLVVNANGNVQFFAGSKTANTIYSQNNTFTPATPSTPSTNTIQILLDTRGVLSASGTNWSVAGYFNGRPLGNLFTYANPNPTNILSLGFSANSAPNPLGDVQYNLMTLVTTLQPFVVKQPTAATILGGNSTYSNSVTVMADTNGGPLFYQWYANNLPLTNGVNNVNGADTNTLVINSVSTANAFTNYYLVVTNNYGSSTSSFGSLIVLTNPVISNPASPSNSVVLFGGADSYVGSSPTFSVTAIGAPPLTYQWLTNGVGIVGATNNSFTFLNLQADGPTNISCVVSNSFSTTNVVWWVTYSNAPTAAYPQAVLTDVPLDFWRLNEADDGNGNLGAVCHDYQSGVNGVYTNVTLGQQGYDALEPEETSMSVGNPAPECVKLISLDLAASMTNGVSAVFSVEAWDNCITANGASGGAPIISQGTNTGCSFFLGADTNSGTKYYQFYVRNAAGTLFAADGTNSGIQANDLNWHHLVGVCDQVHTNISLYIDGKLAASTTITAASGLFESGRPVAIGAGIRSGSADYDVQFTGRIDDVAIYKHALSAAQVISHYAAAGNPVPVSLVPPPPTNFVYLTGTTLSIPTTVAGSGPIDYYWTNVTAGGAALASGEGSFEGGSLDATLNIPNAPASLSGDQLEFVATNPNSSTNWFVTLFSPAAPIALDYSSPILYSNLFNGGTYSIAGLPLTAANLLVGGTSTAWIATLGTNSTGIMQANGVDADAGQGASWLVPFTPQRGYVYTMSGSVTFTGNPGGNTATASMGFMQAIPTNTFDGRFNGATNGFDWMAIAEANGNVQYFLGPKTTTTITNATLFTANTPATHTMTVVLDTTAAIWKAYGWIDAVSTGTNSYAGSNTNPPAIGAAGIAQSGLTAPSFVQWNDWTLTQTSPGGGFAPYAYNPAPPTSVTVVADSALSIPTTAFGSAPFGYYWSNTNTAVVLGSGVTGTTAPIDATLNVADVPFSWNGNTLALVVTNAYGTNISLVSLTVTNATIVPTNQPAITGLNLVGGTNVMISATNGQAGGTYYLLGTTNLATPLSQWVPLATNVIVTNGTTVNEFTFTGTNVIRASNPQQFYILSNTN